MACSGRLAATAITVLVGLLVPHGAMSAQEREPPAPARAKGARLEGRIVERSTAAGVAAAEVVLVEDGRRVRSDSAGYFDFQDLPAGLQRFLVRAPRFGSAEFGVYLTAGASTRRSIQLDSSRAGTSAQELAPVSVTAERRATSYRLMDFDRRRRTGRGHYLDDDEIKRSGASTLVDLARGLRGVRVECGGGGGCRIHMARARRNCAPDYVVDGRADNMFGATTPIRDIVALELYTGPADVPGEFAGTDAGCGVVVIWTRAGPDRAKR